MLTLNVQWICQCKINSENSSTANVGKYVPSVFSMSTISSFGSIENKYDVYRAKDSLQKFCESLIKQEIKIINFNK